MSKLFYKLKSAKDFSSLTFDGPSISVFDAKREIMVATKMGKGVDFGLHLYESGTMEEYTDDSVHIPRNHSVIVRRFPAKAAGKGTAYKYLAGVNQSTPAPSQKATYTGPMSLNLAAASAIQIAAPQVDLDKETEEERTARILQEGKYNYNKKAEELEHSEPRVWSSRGAKTATGSTRSFAQFDKRKPPERGPPPPQYVCFRCCESGHWIQDCPTNGHKEFDRAPKIKRTTGIPKSFLKVVDSPDELRASGRGVMVTQDGSVVVAQANEYVTLHFLFITCCCWSGSIEQYMMSCLIPPLHSQTLNYLFPGCRWSVSSIRSTRLALTPVTFWSLRSYFYRLDLPCEWQWVESSEHDRGSLSEVAAAPVATAEMELPEDQ